MICPNCGNECDENQMFCDKCGTKIKTFTEKYDYNSNNDKEIELIVGGAATEEDENDEINKFLNRDLKKSRLSDTLDDLLDELEDANPVSPKNNKGYKSPSELHKTNNKKQPKMYSAPKTNEGRTVKNSKSNKPKKQLAKKKILIVGLIALASVLVAVFATLIVKKTIMTKDFNKYFMRGNEFYESQNFKEARTQYISAANNAFTNEQKITSYEMIYKTDDIIGGYDEEEISYLEALIDIDSLNIAHYKALIILYQNNDLNDEVNILIESAPSKIRDELRSFDGTIPNASQEEGTYNIPIEIELTATDGVTIYYTTDGSSASTSETKKEYFAPIKFEEEGTYTLRALSVDKNGKNSKEISLKYILDFGQVAPPNVNYASGTYNERKKIEVTADSDCTIYYTTDGSIPTDDSKEYTKSFKMPKGDSLYYFIAIDENGVASKVVTRAYICIPEYNYSYDDAVNSLSSLLVSYGIFENKYGEFENGDIAYFEYEKVVDIKKKPYYLITCDIEDLNGMMKTTTYYAVSCDTGMCHLVRNNGDSYELDEIQNDVEE